MASVWLLTAVHPAKAEYLHELADDIARIKAAGVDVHWTICIDGDGDIDQPVTADSILQITSGGVSVARNLALSVVPHDAWVYPIDADDRLDVAGFLSVYDRLDVIDTERGFISTNRITLDGRYLPGTVTPQDQSIDIWQYANNWSEAQATPHANSVIYRASSLFAAGGWPGLKQHEDVLLLMRVNRTSPGYWWKEVITQYRVWEGQTIRHPHYNAEKQLVYSYIHQVLSQWRVDDNMPPLPLREATETNWIASDLPTL